MERQDPGSAVKRIIAILRKTTRWVQLLPFAYLAVYAMVLLTEPILSDKVYDVVDFFLNVPPIVVAVFLVLSHLLKLCIWHKIACLIPMASRLVNIFDGAIMTLTQGEVVTINTILGFLTIAFICLAYNHIFYGRKGVNTGNA